EGAGAGGAFFFSKGVVDRGAGGVECVVQLSDGDGEDRDPCAGDPLFGEIGGVYEGIDAGRCEGELYGCADLGAEFVVRAVTGRGRSCAAATGGGVALCVPWWRVEMRAARKICSFVLS